MLNQTDFEAAAAMLKCEAAAIRAITDKESSGTGFYGNSNKITIKFEGHIFHHYTQGAYDKQYPDLSYPAWTEKYSQFGPVGSYERFNRAFKLDPYAALMATSWGMFQIMGEHYDMCGFKNVAEFVDYLKVSDHNQLMAFVRYCQTGLLDKYLRGFATNLEANTEAFALRYNGGGYKKNHYDTDIAADYLRLKKVA